MDPNKPYRILLPKTGGFGLRQQPSAEDRKRRAEEAEIESKYARFDSTERSREDNLRYARADVTIKVEETIALSSLTVNDENSTPTNNATNNTTNVQTVAQAFSPAELERYNLIDPMYKELPIREAKEEILSKLSTNQILIIQGDTGCGKTTQVPQYILDDCAKNNANCRMVITQPRRLAAISMANRVCQERGWLEGEICGYKIANERKCREESTRLFFVTTGYLKNELIGKLDQEQLNSYSHIILDEIHERELDTDMVLLLVKLLLLRKFEGKIVLMSATLDATILLKYFKKQSVDMVRCKAGPYLIKCSYLDDLEDPDHFRLSMPTFDHDAPELFDELIDLAGQLLAYFDTMESRIPENGKVIDGFSETRGSVLVFVPGWEEINRVHDYFIHHLDLKLDIMPLHSDIAIEQQMMVFCKSDRHRRKVIISTSIAESSITVTDIKYVIDFCLTKAVRCNIETNLTSLELEWATGSSIDQRKGRVGRVSIGSCYRLITKEFYDAYFAPAEFRYPQPSIERLPIDKLVLDVKRLKVPSHFKPKDVLSMALSPPAEDKINRAILSLKEAGALTLYKDGKFVCDDGELTFAGRIMAELPVDILLSKLILFGHVFGRLKQSVVLAAALSLKTIFGRYFKSTFEFYQGKYAWSAGLNCDFNCIINSYTMYLQKKAELDFDELREWCEQNMLQQKRLDEVGKLAKKIEKHLAAHGLKTDEAIERDDVEARLKTTKYANEEDALNECYLIKFIVAAAFYPNYYVTTPTSQYDAIKILNAKDPKCTVAVKGFDSNDYSALYHKQLMSLFSICSKDLIISYEQDRAYVEFKGFSEIISKVSKGVFMALAFKDKLVLPHTSNVDNRRKKTIYKILELRSAESVRYESRASSSARITTGPSEDALSDANLLLGDRADFQVKITDVCGIGKFWAQIDDDEHQTLMKRLEAMLNDAEGENRPPLRPIPHDELFLGKKVVALFNWYEGRFSLSQQYCRARVVEIGADTVQLIYIDYGTCEEKDKNLLFELDDDLAEIPSQALLCQLIQMRVNPLNVNDANFVDESTVRFSFRCTGKKLKAKIFSVVDNVVRVTLFDITSQMAEIDILNDLIKLEIVEKCAEPENSIQKNLDRTNNVVVQAGSGSRVKSKLDFVQINELEKMLDELVFDESRPFSLRVESPLACKLYGITHSLKSRGSINIDRDSVNYVLLDEEPETQCSSLVVAHKFEEEPEGRTGLKVRNTCLFPKIKGIVSLCLLLFSPKVELRVDKATKSYTGALCGLGCDVLNSKTPFYVEHDIVDHFECEINDKDITIINSIRFMFNSLIGNQMSAKYGIENPERLLQSQRDCRNLVIHLLKRSRKTIEKTSHHRDYIWDLLPERAYENAKLYKYILKNEIKNTMMFMPISKVNFARL